MTTNSLAFRLFATAVAWTLLALPIAGTIIYSLYRQEVDTSFDRRINVLLTVVLNDTIDHGDQEPGEPRDVGEPLFEVTHSGWYWQIRPLDGRPGRNARLSLARRPVHPAAERAQHRAQRARGALGQPGWAPGAATARRREHLRVRRGQDGAALLGRRRRHAGRGGDQPRQLPHAPDAGAVARRRRPAGAHLVPGPLRPLPAGQGGEGPGRRPLGRGHPARHRPAAGDRAAAAGAQRAAQVQPGHRRAGAHPRRQPGARPEDAAGRHRQRGARRPKPARPQGRRAGRRSWPTRSTSISIGRAWRRASA